MALFGGKKKQEKGAQSATPTPSATPRGKVNAALHPGSLLVRPRITEKATALSERGVYVFEVSPRATKKTVAGAIEALYRVKPVRVHMVRLPQRNVPAGSRGGFPGKAVAIKKAYVYLKKGETIDIA